MSTDGSIELLWAGDNRKFKLAIENLIALQEKRNSGPMEIANRLRFGTWKIEDITETIRIGLIGAGVDWKAAEKLVTENVKPGQITYHTMTAFAIIMAALQGDPDTPVGKENAVTDKPEAAASPPPPYTDPAQ
jgi:hypothetical protein